MFHGVEVKGWARDLDELGVWLGGHFLHSEPRRRALAYLCGERPRSKFGVDR